MGEIDSQQVFGYALYKDGKNTKLSYPLEKFDSDVSGRSFHNGRFIQRLREKASTLPKYTNFYHLLRKMFLKRIFFPLHALIVGNVCSVKLEQGTVTSLVEENGIIKGVNYKTRSGQELTAKAPLTIVCDGCFSNLRRSLCNPKVNILSFSLSLSYHLPVFISFINDQSSLKNFSWYTLCLFCYFQGNCIKIDTVSYMRNIYLLPSNGLELFKSVFST